MEEIPSKKSSARQSILLHLKKSDAGLTVDELAQRLEVTPMAVRRHLGVLESAGLLRSVVERRPKGRPAHVYSLAEAGHDIFPSNYSGLLNVLLECLEETSGPEAVQTIFERWKEKLVSFARERLDGLAFEERLQGLVRLLEDEGFMPEVEQERPGVYRLLEYNCPIRKVATRYDEACHFEQEVYRELLGGSVERVRRIVDGDACCAYVVVADPDAGPEPGASGPSSSDPGGRGASRPESFEV